MRSLMGIIVFAAVSSVNGQAAGYTNIAALEKTAPGGVQYYFDFGPMFDLHNLLSTLGTIHVMVFLKMTMET